jgi:hypothetical protein
VTLADLEQLARGAAALALRRLAVRAWWRVRWVGGLNLWDFRSGTGAGLSHAKPQNWLGGYPAAGDAAFCILSEILIRDFVRKRPRPVSHCRAVEILTPYQCRCDD